MIFNLSAGDNTSEEVEVLLTEFMNEVNNTLTSFKSEINTMLTGFTRDVDSDMTAINNSISTLTNKVSNLGGAVKSVQRGVARGTTPSAGNAPSNVTININKVNPSKSIVLFSLDSINGATTTYMPRVVSFAETSITVTPVGGYNNGFDFITTSFGWQVIEFY